MSASSYAELADHVGHAILCVGYAYDKEHMAWANVSVECNTCSTVLFGFDHPEVVLSDAINAILTPEIDICLRCKHEIGHHLQKMGLWPCLYCDCMNFLAMDEWGECDAPAIAGPHIGAGVFGEGQRYFYSLSSDLDHCTEHGTCFAHCPSHNEHTVEADDEVDLAAIDDAEEALAEGDIIGEPSYENWCDCAACKGGQT